MDILIVDRLWRFAKVVFCLCTNRENQWLAQMKVLLLQNRPIFRGCMLVSGSVRVFFIDTPTPMRLHVQFTCDTPANVNIHAELEIFLNPPCVNPKYIYNYNS